MSDTDIKATYDAAQNPEGIYFDGVPLRDLTKKEFDELHQWTREGVLASGFYTEVQE